jgi:alpha-beta hydrolase superfamily lysophospholipase
MSVAVILLVLAWSVFLKPAPRGWTLFFADVHYQYQTLRAFSHIQYGGAEPGEILSVLTAVCEGDNESWFREWAEISERVEEMGLQARDSVSRGRALLRAHNYYRTAEFFLNPDDPRRLETFRKNVKAFHAGLDALGVDRETMDIPYESGHLNAIYYPAPTDRESKPLIVACGGYDSTMEELFFVIGAGALERGYSVLTYEGPGQGAALREQGMKFTHEWETPTSAVLDYFLERHEQPEKIILYGLSLGGYLAPRAASRDERVDGLILNNHLYDMRATALQLIPSPVVSLYENDHPRLVNALMKMKMRLDTGLRWGIKNTEWAMGSAEPVEALERFAKYSLENVAEDVTSDVLILAAEKDHMIPLSQAYQLERALVNARSVEVRVFPDGEGAQAHCEFGAITQSHLAIFDWIDETFRPL